MRRVLFFVLALGLFAGSLSAAVYKLEGMVGGKYAIVIELEAEASWVQGKSITEMKEQQLKQFNNVEASMLKLQKQFEYRTIQYIIPQEGGNLKKYIYISRE